VSNIDAPVLLYENKSNGTANKPSVEISLQGSASNINAIGAKVVLFANNGIRTYEKNPAKGFQSSMETPLHIGLANTKIDSAFLIWPDNSCQKIGLDSRHHQVTFKWQKGLPKFDYTKITRHHAVDTKPMEDITAQTKLAYLHKENHFVEFDREQLIPHMVSTEGPALAVGDINHDGLQDVFVGASKTFHNGVFLQQPNGTFIKKEQPAMAIDSMFEDVDASLVDVNNDGNPDLLVASGGNEYYGEDEHLLPRVYLNDGKGGFTKLAGAFGNMYNTASCIVPFDFNGDGFVDVFVGGRAVPWAYGQIPASYLLVNDGHGKFIDVTTTVSSGLADVGMVTQALWFDIDKDGQKDLLVCCEWGGIYAFINNKGHFTRTVLTDKKGWWNFVLPVDVNNDGNIDLIAGNLGLNSRLQASDKEPVRLYYNDFDDNGKAEQVLTYYLQGKEIPFANKDELQRQMPIVKKRFLYADDFAKATLQEIFTSQKLNGAQMLTANYFSNAVLINHGKLNFSTEALPWQAQLAPYRDAVVVNANNDSLPDILMMGNFYDNNIQMGRYDGDFGTVLVNKGQGKFTCENINGLTIKGQVRHIKPVEINRQPAYILARNNDSIKIIRYVPLK